MKERMQIVASILLATFVATGCIAVAAWHVHAEIGENEIFRYLLTAAMTIFVFMGIEFAKFVGKHYPPT